jgi:hypothetical protein
MLHFLLKTIKIDICKLIKFHNLELLKIIHINGFLDIHAYDEFAFKYSCRRGHLDIAKWLISKGEEINNPINIHIDDEYAFRYSCRGGHLYIAKWLISKGEDLNSPIDRLFTQMMTLQFGGVVVMDIWMLLNG